MAEPEQPNWSHLFGMGLQVAVGVGLGAIIGTWLDNRFHWAPWGVIIGILLGCSAGMYLLIKDTMKMNKN